MSKKELENLSLFLKSFDKEYSKDLGDKIIIQKRDGKIDKNEQDAFYEEVKKMSGLEGNTVPLNQEAFDKLSNLIKIEKMNLTETDIKGWYFDSEGIYYKWNGEKLIKKGRCVVEADGTYERKDVLENGLQTIQYYNADDSRYRIQLQETDSGKPVDNYKEVLKKTNLSRTYFKNDENGLFGDNKQIYFWNNESKSFEEISRLSDEKKLRAIAKICREYYLRNYELNHMHPAIDRIGESYFNINETLAIAQRDIMEAQRKWDDICLIPEEIADEINAIVNGR